MPKEIVTVRAGGVSWTGFTSIELEGSIEHACDHFSMSTPATLGNAATKWAFAPGAAIRVYCGSDLVFTGFTDRYCPRLKTARIEIAGRSKAQDFIDCAAIHDTGRFENQTLLQIAQALDQYGCGFSTDQQLEQIAEYQVTPGESAFEAIERLARKQGLALAGQPDGSIKITKAGTQRHGGGLYEGRNLLDAGADFNWAHRHSKIIVRGQKPDGSGATATQIEATSEDTSLGRNRPLVLIEDGDLTQEEAQQRADMRRDREAGNSLKGTVTVAGFRDGGGTLWTPGYLVWVQSPFLDLAQLMLIKHRAFQQSGEDEVTNLTLVDPRAFGGKAGKGGSAGSAWDIDDED